MKKTIEAIAKTCHEANRAYCESIGDHSQVSWEDAPEWQRTSAINGVIFVMSNPDAGDEASHNSWLAEKRMNGWKYGEVKDTDAKTHPCFLPFNELPPEQQFKDKLFRAIVLANMRTVPGDTIGARRVRTSFNPSELDTVAEFKQDCADLIDDLAGFGNHWPNPADMDDSTSYEKQRCISIAQTRIEEAAMWGVKALTM